MSGDRAPPGAAAEAQGVAEGSSAASSAAASSMAANSTASAAPARGEASAAAQEAATAAGAPPKRDADPPVYEVNVKCIDGSITKLEVPGDLRGSDLKELLLEQLGVAVDRQRLIFRGHVLKDDDLVGSHITESGQTLHMVQRPAPPSGHEAHPHQPQQPLLAGGTGGEAGLPQAGLPLPTGTHQLHFQFTAPAGGPAQIAMPQVDLSQLLGGVFGSVGRGGGLGGLLQAGTGAAGAGAAGEPAPGVRAGHGGGAQSVRSGAGHGGGAQSVRSGGGISSPPPPPHHGGAALAAASSSWASTTPLGGAVHGAATAPAGAQGDHGALLPETPPPPPSAALMQELPAALAQAMAAVGAGAEPPWAQQGMGMGGAHGAAAVALQPLQIIFPHGLGNLAQVNPNAFADRSQGSAASHGGHSSSGEALPWRDLRRLHQHLSRVLGRANQYRNLPPTNMPSGDLGTFLPALLGAHTQLGVAITDLQASLADGVGPSPRDRLQFAMTLVAAARTFRGLATAMQSGSIGSTALPTAAAETREQATQSSHAGGEVPAAPGASSESEEADHEGEGPRSDSSRGQDLVCEDEAGTEFLEPIAEGTLGSDGASGTGPVAGVSSSMTVPSGNDGDIAGGGSMESSLEAAEMMQMLPQLLGRLAQPLTGGVRAAGDTYMDDGLAAMPPEVAACWQRWTQPELLRRMEAEAQQAPLSEAYRSGDTTGSSRPTAQQPPLSEVRQEAPRGEALPAVEDLFRQRRREGAEHVQDVQEQPEPPDPLSRAYVGAVLCDLGRHLQNSATDNSVPQAMERYPHLAQLAALLAPLREAGGTASAGDNTSPALDGSTSPALAEPPTPDQEIEEDP